MKKNKTILYVLMYLPLIFTIIALRYLPEQIPAHYGANNEVTRYGSKYESLILPIFNVLFGYFMILMSKVAMRQEKGGENNAKITLLAGIYTAVLFGAMSVFFLYTSYNKVNDLSHTPIDINQITMGITGLFLIVIGNVLPKTKRNSILGVRTPASMKDDETWRKSQRFGGKVCMICGMIMIMISLTAKGMMCIFLNLAVLISMAFVIVIGTNKIGSR